MATADIQPPIATPFATTLLHGSAGRRLFTVSEYALMAEKGIFKPEERTELLGGEVRLMNAMGPRHAVLVRRLTAFLIAQYNDQYIVSPQCPLQLDKFSEPEPDLVLLKWRSDEYSNSHPQSDDVLLLIEIGDSTLKFEREEKLPRYAAVGIPEVWIVDVQQQQIEQYSAPNQGSYEKKDVRKLDDEIRSLGSPTVVVQVGKLFA